MIIGNGHYCEGGARQWDGALSLREKIAKEIRESDGVETHKRGNKTSDTDDVEGSGRGVNGGAEEGGGGPATTGQRKGGKTVVESMNKKDNRGHFLPWLFRRSGLFGMTGLEALEKQLQSTNEKIDEAVEQLLSSGSEQGNEDGRAKKGQNGARQRAMRVYCTFENEHSQRRCLRALRVGLAPALFDVCKGNVKAFRGENILCVREAPEADAVIWENCGTPLVRRLIQQALTMVLTLLAVCGSVLLATILPVEGVAIWIVVTNFLFPQFLRRLCLVLEVVHTLSALKK